MRIRGTAGIGVWPPREEPQGERAPRASAAGRPVLARVRRPARKGRLVLALLLSLATAAAPLQATPDAAAAGLQTLQSVAAVETLPPAAGAGAGAPPSASPAAASAAQPRAPGAEADEALPPSAVELDEEQSPSAVGLDEAQPPSAVESDEAQPPSAVESDEAQPSAAAGPDGTPPPSALGSDGALPPPSEAGEGTVLLLYDSLGKGTPYEGNVEALQRLLAAFGVPVEPISIDDYEEGTMGRYGRVIGVTNRPDLTVPERYTTDLQRYAGRYLHIGRGAPEPLRQRLRMHGRETGADTVRLSIGQWSQEAVRVDGMYDVAEAAGTLYGVIESENGDRRSPFAVRQGDYAYMPHYAVGDLSELAAAYVLRDWLGIRRQGSPYIMITGVHPFLEPESVAALADRMALSGVPFIAGASPVSRNYDYPAMKRYIHALQTMQWRGGSVFVQAPVISAVGHRQPQDLSALLAGFVDELAASSIAPLGMRAELYWSYDRLLAAEGLGMFDSVLLGPNERPMYAERVNRAEPFVAALYELPWETLRQWSIAGDLSEPLPIDIAVTFPMPEDVTGMDAIAESAANSRLIFADYKFQPHETRTDSYTIMSRNGRVYINGKAVALEQAPAPPENEAAVRPENRGSFAAFFSVQNRIFLFVIPASLLVFLYLLFIGRRLYKRKFYR